MIAVHDTIREIQAELRSACLTRRERAQAQAELKKLVAEQARLDRAFDAAFADKVPPD